MYLTTIDYADPRLWSFGNIEDDDLIFQLVAGHWIKAVDWKLIDGFAVIFGVDEYGTRMCVPVDRAQPITSGAFGLWQAMYPSAGDMLKAALRHPSPRKLSAAMRSFARLMGARA